MSSLTMIQPSSVIGVTVNLLWVGKYLVELKISLPRLITVPSTEGETTGSSEVTVTATDSVSLTWTPVINADGYKVYRTAAGGSTGTEVLLTTIVGGATNSFLDDGSLTPGSATVPGSNTATNRPATGATYYVNYVKTVKTYNVPKLWTNLNDLIAAHGLTSDLAVAGSWIMGPPSGQVQGQGAGTLITVAVPDSPQLSDWQAALATLEQEPVDWVEVLTGDPGAQMALAQHIVAMSSPIVGNNRKGVYGSEIGTPIGDPLTAGTSVYQARRLNINDEWGNPNGYRGLYVANSSAFYQVQQTDGSFVNTQVAGWMLAAAVAGRIVTRSDRATPLSEKDVAGIISLGQVFTLSQRDYLETEGLTLVYGSLSDAQFFVYHGRMLDLLTIENSELSIVDADDQIDMDVRASLKAMGVNKIDDAFCLAAKRKIIQVLGIEQKNEILATYNKGTVDVRPDSTYPLRVNATFAYTPIYPGNQIVVTRSYDVSA